MAKGKQVMTCTYCEQDYMARPVAGGLPFYCSKPACQDAMRRTLVTRVCGVVTCETPATCWHPKF